jgi:predicted acyltransferase
VYKTEFTVSSGSACVLQFFFLLVIEPRFFFCYDTVRTWQFSPVSRTLRVGVLFRVADWSELQNSRAKKNLQKKSLAVISGVAWFGTYCGFAI